MAPGGNHGFLVGCLGCCRPVTLSVGIARTLTAAHRNAHDVALALEFLYRCQRSHLPGSTGAGPAASNIPVIEDGNGTAAFFDNCPIETFPLPCLMTKGYVLL